MEGSNDDGLHVRVWRIKIHCAYQSKYVRVTIEGAPVGNVRVRPGSEHVAVCDDVLEASLSELAWLPMGSVELSLVVHGIFLGGVRWQW
jgi:hypothetical protein